MLNCILNTTEHFNININKTLKLSLLSVLNSNFHNNLEINKKLKFIYNIFLVTTAENNNIEICEPSPSQINNLIGNSIESISSSQSFKELLLKTMKQANKHKTTSKRKVGFGSSVITTDESIKILKDNDEEIKKKKNKA